MLDLDLATVAFQIVNFLALAALLYFLLFRPVMKNVRERSDRKAQMLKEIEDNRAAAEKLRSALEARLASAEEEAAAIVIGARQEAEIERDSLLQETHAEVERILAKAHVDAYQMRGQELEDLHEDILDTILEVSTLVISHVAPEELHETMVRHLNERIWEMGHSEMDRVRTFRRSLGERAPTAYVTVAAPLSAEQQGELARTLTALADRNVQLELTIDPTLAAGLRVRMGDVIVDGSIAGQIADLRERASETITERFGHE
jgi:F0F1-type ATP synthase membrane subunit b/b'